MAKERNFEYPFIEQAAHDFCLTERECKRKPQEAIDDLWAYVNFSADHRDLRFATVLDRLQNAVAIRFEERDRARAEKAAEKAAEEEPVEYDLNMTWTPKEPPVEEENDDALRAVIRDEVYRILTEATRGHSFQREEVTT